VRWSRYTRRVVAAHLARSRYPYEGGHRFVVLIEERVLRTRIGTTETMAGRLGHRVYDDQRAVVETRTASGTRSTPRSEGRATVHNCGETNPDTPVASNQRHHQPLGGRDL
jgi:hypothetical protein